MFFDNYPIKLSDMTKPSFLKGLKTAPAILLIHGYTGSPNEMLWLGNQLNESGYNVFIPRLPGHGTNKDDFLSSSWKDWLRSVCELYIDLCSMYDQVYVGGLSMGGLLASIIAAKFNPEKIFLCAPAFAVTDKRIKFTPFLKFFIKKIPVQKDGNSNISEYSKILSDYKNYDYLAKVADFYKLQRLAIKNMPFIKSQTLIILSKEDKMVPFSVKKLIDKHLKTQIDYTILEKSGHILVQDIEKEIVAKKILEFLKKS